MTVANLLRRLKSHDADLPVVVRARWHLGGEAVPVEFELQLVVCEMERDTGDERVVLECEDADEETGR